MAKKIGVGVGRRGKGKKELLKKVSFCLSVSKLALIDDLAIKKGFKRSDIFRILVDDYFSV